MICDLVPPYLLDIINTDFCHTLGTFSISDFNCFINTLFTECMIAFRQNNLLVSHSTNCTDKHSLCKLISINGKFTLYFSCSNCINSISSSSNAFPLGTFLALWSFCAIKSCFSYFILLICCYVQTFNVDFSFSFSFSKFMFVVWRALWESFSRFNSVLNSSIFFSKVSRAILFSSINIF